MTSEISHDEARKLLLKTASGDEVYLSLCRYVEQQRQATCTHIWRGIDSGRICATCLKEEKQ